MIGITMGDANGVGPEILLRAVAEGIVPLPCRVYGDRSALELAARKLDLHAPLEKLEQHAEIVDPGLLSVSAITPGKVNADVGTAAIRYIKDATMDAVDGTISAVVTLPVNKEACRFAEPDFSGHTDYIAELCESQSVTMMLASEELIVTHVSTHVSLTEAIARVTHDRVLEVLKLTHDAVSKLRPQVRIAVAGLNPHAGEGNAFGTEDSTIIAPAIAAAREAGIDAHGPEPADTVFYNTVHKKRFEAVVCMYHDQGHIPMKTLDFDGGVNVTLGLPIIRTSVDHGTAYDIAYKGIARLRSFRLAVEMADTMGAPR